jgi:hypothetical protein
MSGSAGVLGLLSGNSAGVPGLTTTAPTGSNGRAAVTIIIGSGADDASAPIIPPVTRNTVANDAVNAAPVIGRVSGDDSSVLPPGQVYRDGVPVTGPAGVSTKAHGQPAGSLPDEKPADPLRIRLREPAHRLASDASGNLVKSDADRAPLSPGDSIALRGACVPPECERRATFRTGGAPSATPGE